MIYRLIVYLTCVYLSACASHSFDESAPQLRLNTEMHTARIWRHAVDANERYLVTGSDDKTARIWSLQSGELLRVLRAPIGLGAEGWLAALAMSPDGETVALGGLIRCKLNLLNCVYLFNRQTGKVTQRITWLRDFIWYLAYSADARYLAISEGKYGIAVYDTSNYKKVFSDTDYDEPSLCITFADDGRIFTSSLDGYIRSYSKDFKLTNKRRISGGKQAYNVALSPQQDKLAVGFLDSTAIRILSANDLSLLASPDTGRFANGNLRNLSWSADGQQLFAAGSYEDATGSSPVLVYSNLEELQAPESWHVGSSNSITALRALENGNLLVTSADPLWAVINQQGKVYETSAGNLLLRQGKTYNFRNIDQGSFSLSADAGYIRFSATNGSRQSIEFDLHKQQLAVTDNTSAPALTEPLTQTNRFTISAWKNQFKPGFNGKTIALNAYEHARSLAISHDARHFLLGAEWSLRYFNDQGKKLWKNPVPSTPWAVNIAGNNKLAIVAYGDGTIRWYRLQDGAELLALYIHPENQHWVLWTPQGYYSASIGGESLVGWHVNHGVKRAAEFYEIGQFRSRFYRPDIIAEVLPQLDVNAAVSAANIKRQQGDMKLKIAENLPPSIVIEPLNKNNQFDGQRIHLRFNISNPSQTALKPLKVLMDDHPMPKHYIVKQTHEELLLHQLPANSFKLGLVVEDEHGIISEVAEIQLNYVISTDPRGVKRIADIEQQKGKLYVLAIGNSEYTDTQVAQLNYADNDAQAFSEFMLSQTGKELYTDVVVKPVLNANRAAILTGFSWLKEHVKRHDTAIIFLAGHGFSEKGKYYFLPKDGNSNLLETSAISYLQLKKTLTELEGKSLLFLDSCHSGALMGGQLQILDINYIINELTSQQNGIIVFTASKAQQFSYESSALGHGFFTQALLDTFMAKTEEIQSNTKLSVFEMIPSISNRVEALTLKANLQQNPTITMPRAIADYDVLIAGEH